MAQRRLRLDDRVRADRRGLRPDASVPFNVFQTNLGRLRVVTSARLGEESRSAVGEGSVVVQAIHARLASLRRAEAPEPVTL